ncbi:hypothetical protein [Rhizobium sp. Rhizsp82]|uniref:hypothetical protein n=1 Tax=Rhizobium sp. Rhizsp82 TaxID=3243057 RepID=UPI0039B393EC
MALTTPLITAGFVGSFTSRWASLALPGKQLWSERGALPYTTTKTAPEPIGDSGDPAFTVFSPVDVLIAIGKAPNAATEPLFFLPANTERSYYAQPGDKLSVAAA